MINRMRQFMNGRRNNINEIVSELRVSKLLSEFFKAVIISGLTLLISFIIRLFSSGNFEGDKLQAFLDKSILKYVNTSNIDSQVLYNGTYDKLSEDKIIFVYSRYTTPDSDDLSTEYLDKYGEYYDGVCLSIFERKDRSVINALPGTEPSYELVFCSNTEGNSMTYKYDGFDSSDLDEDGLTEFYLYTKSYFASTNSHEIYLDFKT